MSIKKKEIERKFLLKRVPRVDYDNVIEIDQYYIGNVRYRKTIGNDGLIYEKIIKTVVSPGVNEEEIFDTTREEYDKNIQKEDKYIRKRRYLIEVGKYIFEIDEFTDIRLCVLEIEVGAEDELFRDVYIPEVIKKEIIKEVTGDPAFSNFNLAY